ncbi:hypothetical protein INR49_029162 [Caranx melampygus]|nr:hypothetical protein INR49_029162 [Caranx melampygus]
MVASAGGLGAHSMAKANKKTDYMVSLQCASVKVQCGLLHSFLETLSTAAFDSIKEFDALLASSRTPFVTNNSHYDHDDDKLTVWPEDMEALLWGPSSPMADAMDSLIFHPDQEEHQKEEEPLRRGHFTCVTPHLLITVFFLLSTLLLSSSLATSCPPP